MTGPTNNPHEQVAGAYGDNAVKNTPDQRELEARALLKAAKMISDLQMNWDQVDQTSLEETLKYNRKIWVLFYETATQSVEEGRPNSLKASIINLATFIFKRETEILSDPNRQPEKLDTLININKEIAAGLMASA
ncbi:MAG: flagellar biosynthesis regulator FlaF [Pseudomonadota bacterium]